MKTLNFLFFSILLTAASTLKAEAAPQFAKKQIKVAGHSIQVEIADNPEKWAYGLMFRKALPADEGMLFIFNEEEPRSFWMKNTFVALSIGYFNSKKILVDVQDMEPMKTLMQKETPSYPSKAPAQYALEMNQGWFRKKGIKLGDRLEIQSKVPDLSQKK